MNEVDYKNAMSQFATGVVIISGNQAGELVGFAAQSFVSLSINPPMVLFCPQKTSSSWPKVRALAQFSINILNENQRDLSDAFAIPGEVPVVDWRQSCNKNPIIDQAIATIECTFNSEHDAGDHTIAVANVNAYKIHDEEAKPLLYFRGSYDL
ncbi:MAG: flavin reductase family protein [Gammaproteobacteria bacterium]|nr:flavin reductase family protein [Gammaproteobacteria bacterium]